MQYQTPNMDLMAELELCATANLIPCSSPTNVLDASMWIKSSPTMLATKTFTGEIVVQWLFVRKKIGRFISSKPD